MEFGKLGYGPHSFLNDYIPKNMCRRIMEIGIADGENARTMILVASNNFPIDQVEYYGFDIFGWNGETHMKRVKQKLEATGCRVRLFKGDSTITLPKFVENLPMMDLIFIDGDHSHPTVKSDWEHSKKLMHDKPAVFFQNYDFYGLKRLVDNISRDIYNVEIISLHRDYPTALVMKKT